MTKLTKPQTMPLDTPDDVVRVPAIKLQRLHITTAPLSPYLSNAFPLEEQEKLEARNASVEKTRQPKKAIDPEKAFLATLRPLPGTEVVVQRERPGTGYKAGEKIAVPKGGAFGVPVSAFKGALVRAAGNIGDKKTLSMVVTKAALHIVEPEDGSGLIPIHDAQTGKPAVAYFNRTTCRNQTTGGAILVYTGQFRRWSCVFDVEFDANVLTPLDVVTLIENAGFGVGIGGHRPEGPGGGKTGSFGRFCVKGEVE
jgi:hypothetical protein